MRREQISFNVVVSECAEAGRIRNEPRPSVDLSSRSYGRVKTSIWYDLGPFLVPPQAKTAWYDLGPFSIPLKAKLAW